MDKQFDQVQECVRQLNRVDLSTADRISAVLRGLKLLRGQSAPQLYVTLSHAVWEVLRYYPGPIAYLDDAIAALTTCVSLDVCTSEQMAKSHLYLAEAMLSNGPYGRPQVDMSCVEQHVRTVIDMCQPNTYPELWAHAHHMLGLVEIQKGRFDEAIPHYQMALDVFAPHSSLLAWATVRSDLGLALIMGEDASCVEKSITVLEDVLRKLERCDSASAGFLRVHAEHRLGLAYRYRTRGRTDDNIELAIRSFKSALAMMPDNSSPETRANILAEYGRALVRRIKGDRSQNVQQAIRQFGDAQKCFTKDARPKQWARLERDIGSAYIADTGRNNPEELRQACEHFHNAIETYGALKEEWLSIMTKRLLKIAQEMLHAMQ